jgi:hypothetical protein
MHSLPDLSAGSAYTPPGCGGPSGSKDVSPNNTLSVSGLRVNAVVVITALGI